MKYTVESELHVWNGDGGWHFIYLPKECWTELQSFSRGMHKRGFGAIKVRVTLQSSAWETSIFPDTKEKRYILFIKKQIRVQEHLMTGSSAQCTVEVLLDNM